MLISVIIPVYNAENYLDKTIDSVINQSLGFDNIELILIDDNSKDNSKKIIERYCDKYENIIAYYSEENHGFPGFGRNMGLKLATSEYIMFLDNDDEYDADICKNLLDAIVDIDADMASCGRVLINDISEIKDDYQWIDGKDYEDYIIFENEDILSFDSITIWNKIFKKEIIDFFNLTFIEDSSADDFVFSIDYHLKSKKIVHLKNYHGYLWNIRNDSLSHDIKLEHIEEVLQAYTNHIINKHWNKIRNSNILVNHMVFLLVSKCAGLNVNFKDFKKILNDIYNFENKFDIDIKINNRLFNTANILILKKHFYLAILYLNMIRTLRKSSNLRKFIGRIT